jgi:ferritin-like metal-binding protein YciE
VTKLSLALTRIKEMHSTERAIWRDCVLNDRISVSALKMALKQQIDQTEKFLNELETTVPKEVRK